jgi:hypothetical protein
MAVFRTKYGKYRASVTIHVGHFDSEPAARQACDQVYESRPLRQFREWIQGQFGSFRSVRGGMESDG